MANLIKNHDIIANDWKVIVPAANESPEAVKLPYGNVLVPVAVWKVRKWDLIQRQWDQGHQLGVWLGPQDDPAEIAADLDDFNAIGVHFPVAGDGRGYSLATLLRTRYGYRGELRAIGAVERDYLHFLRRVGFDAFEVDDAENAVASLDVFSVAYQPAAGQSLPLLHDDSVPPARAA